MTYIEALNLKNKNSHLIGLTNDRGFKIDNIIILPSNKNFQEKFLLTLAATNDAERALSPYKDNDLVVWAIDTRHFVQSNVLFYKVIEE